MLVSCAADEFLTQVKETQPLQRPPFVWKALHWDVPCPITGNLVFSLYFDTNRRMHWTDVYVDTSGFDTQGNTAQCRVSLQEQQTTLSFQYSARKRFYPSYGGLLLVVTVHSIEVVPRVFSAIQERFMDTEQHYVVAFCNDAYLGRPQAIATSAHAPNGVRKYTWKADSVARPFPQVAVRDETHLESIQQQALELERIRSHLPVTARQVPNVVRVADHDGYSNPMRVIPVQIQRGKTLRLQFYNLRFNPPRMAEERIRWATLERAQETPPPPLSNPRRASWMRLNRRRDSMATPKPIDAHTLQVPITPHMDVCISYAFNEGGAKVTKLCLVAKCYLTSLCQMGQDVAPNSV